MLFGISKLSNCLSLRFDTWTWTTSLAQCEKGLRMVQSVCLTNKIFLKHVLARKDEKVKKPLKLKMRVDSGGRQWMQRASNNNETMRCKHAFKRPTSFAG